MSLEVFIKIATGNFMAPWGSVKFMSNFDDVYYNAAFLGHC